MRDSLKARATRYDLDHNKDCGQCDNCKYCKSLEDALIHLRGAERQQMRSTLLEAYSTHPCTNPIKY